MRHKRRQQCASRAHPFGYTGRRWDPDLNLYYYRARWYDPQLGTFLETDPIGSLDYVNLYSYVGLEPGNGTDPSGMICQGDNTRNSPSSCTVDRWKGQDVSMARLSVQDRRNIKTLESSMTRAYNRMLRAPSKSDVLRNGKTGRGAETGRVTNNDLINAARYHRVNVDPDDRRDGYNDQEGVITIGYYSFVEGANGRENARWTNNQEITFGHELLHGTQAGRVQNWGINDSHTQPYNRVASSLLGVPLD